MAFTRYVGRAARQGVYSLNGIEYLPYCGSDTVALTFAP